MRIAIVTPVFPTNGKRYRGNSNYHIALKMQKLAKVRVFCPMPVFPRWKPLQPRNINYDLSDANWAPPGVETVYLPYRTLPVVARPWNSARIERVLLPHFREFQPDFVLGYWLYPDGLAAVRAAADLGVPAVVCALGSDLMLEGDFFTRRGRARAVREAVGVVSLSRPMSERAFELGADPARVRIISNGCDLDVFGLRSRSEARAALGVAPDAEIVLFVGWLSPRKGLDLLLEILPQLAAKRPRVEFVVIGEGPLDASAGPHIRSLGTQSSIQISQWLAAADLLTLPSDSEGCPSVVLEALACGRPVVGSNVGSMPQMISAGSGIVIPKRNSVALLQALDAALDRDWDEATIAAANQRSWEDVVGETLEFCRFVAKA